MPTPELDGFDLWLSEVENFGLRSERIFDDLAGADKDHILSWLRAAYDVGYERGQESTR